MPIPPYETRIINVIRLISLFKIFLNAILFGPFEVIVAALCTVVSGACYYI